MTEEQKIVIMELIIEYGDNCRDCGHESADATDFRLRKVTLFAIERFLDSIGEPCVSI